MSFDDLFVTEPRPSQCRFKKEYENLDVADREKLRTAFANPEITTSYIYRVLNQNGFTVSESTIRTHRKGECRTCGTIA
jgi:hypothetical protein